MTTIASPPEDHHKIFQSLKSWVEEKGGQVHPSLMLQAIPTSDRGLFASEDISKGELLIRIPPALVISGEKLPAKFKNRNASPWLRCLACLYLAQDDEDWKPYIASLPSSYETLWQWSDEEAKYLNGTTLGKTLQADRQENTTQTRYEEYVKPYLKYLKVKIPGDKPPMDLFELISMALSTRGFHMTPSDNFEPSTATATPGPYCGPFLLPVMDLLNHSDSPQHKVTTFQRDAQSKAFYMIAERDIKKGEEILHSYGDKLTAAQLLLTFGFVPDNKMEACLANNYPTSNHLTPSIFSQSEIIEACTKVKQSNYPQQIQETMQQGGMEGDVFPIPKSTQKRDLSFLPDQFLLQQGDHDDSLLSDELVTLCAIQMLPDEAYQEIGQDLLQPEILQDYFLGKLVGMALLNAIQSKLATYDSAFPQEEEKDDKKLMETLLQLNRNDPVKRRILSALTIRLEEKRGLETFRKQVLALIASLDDKDENDDDEDDDDALQELLRQRMEAKRPAKKQKSE